MSTERIIQSVKENDRKFANEVFDVWFSYFTQIFRNFVLKIHCLSPLVFPFITMITEIMYPLFDSCVYFILEIIDTTFYRKSSIGNEHKFKH